MAHRRDTKLEKAWRRRVREQEVGGRSVRDYCGEHGLAESAFYFWRRTIASRDHERRSEATTQAPDFVPVAVVDVPSRSAAQSPTSESTPIDIRLAGGRRLRVRAGCDRDLLAMVLAVLEAKPC